jgi:hypothetical protein
MNIYLIYGFLVGLFVGQFTNIISNFIITGIILSFCKPDFYTYDNIIFYKNITVGIMESFLK